MINEKVLIEEFKSMLNTMVVDADGTHTVSLEAVIAFIEMFPTIQPQGIDKDRLIDTAEAIIDALEGVIEDAKQLPSQPTTDGWIPCSERLPEISGKYLCSYGDGYVGTFCFTTNLYLLAPLNFNRHKYNERKGFYECDSMYGYYEIENVTAWQPLPPAYKESE